MTTHNEQSTGTPGLGSGQMFDAIAERYDFVNRVLSLGIDQRWRRQTVRALGLGPAARVLDLATGTADLALAVAHAHPDATIVGVDPSEHMLRVGKTKLGEAASRVSLELGDAEHLQFEDDSFDAVTIAFGIRNVGDRVRALAEMARVCRPDGRVAILEFSDARHGALAPFARAWVHQAVPRLGALLSGAREYRYLEESIARFPSPDEFGEAMESAGLRVLEIVPMTFGVCQLFVATPR